PEPHGLGEPLGASRDEEEVHAKLGARARREDRREPLAGRDLEPHAVAVAGPVERPRERPAPRERLRRRRAVVGLELPALAPRAPPGRRAARAPRARPARASARPRRPPRPRAAPPRPRRAPPTRRAAAPPAAARGARAPPSPPRSPSPRAAPLPGGSPPARS